MYLQGLLAASFYAVAALLLLAGVVKLLSPQPTADALAGVGVRAGRSLGRALGAVELAVGVAAFVRPELMAPAVLALYACFAGFVAYVLRRDLPLSSCGCLGETDTKPSAVHVGVTAVAAAVAGVASVAPPPPVPELIAEAPLEGALFVVVVATGCYLTYLILVSLPDAFGAYRQPERETYD